MAEAGPDRNVHRVGREILVKLEPKMRAGFMRFHRELSQGPHELLALASALVVYARDCQQLKDMAYAMWPKLRVFKLSASKLQFVPSGEADGDYFMVEVPK
jgi:hypothetical protein